MGPGVGDRERHRMHQAAARSSTRVQSRLSPRSGAGALRRRWRCVSMSDADHQDQKNKTEAAPALESEGAREVGPPVEGFRAQADVTPARDRSGWPLWIQAGAAVGQLVTAVVLAWITWQYVGLTGQYVRLTDKYVQLTDKLVRAQIDPVITIGYDHFKEELAIGNDGPHPVVDISVIGDTFVFVGPPHNMPLGKQIGVRRLPGGVGTRRQPCTARRQHHRTVHRVGRGHQGEVGRIH